LGVCRFSTCASGSPLNKWTSVPGVFTESWGVVTALQANTQYAVRVAAVNKFGRGAWSSASHAAVTLTPSGSSSSGSSGSSGSGVPHPGTSSAPALPAATNGLPSGSSGGSSGSSGSASSTVSLPVSPLPGQRHLSSAGSSVGSSTGPPATPVTSGTGTGTGTGMGTGSMASVFSGAVPFLGLTVSAPPPDPSVLTAAAQSHSNRGSPIVRSATVVAAARSSLGTGSANVLVGLGSTGTGASGTGSSGGVGVGSSGGSTGGIAAQSGGASAGSTPLGLAAAAAGGPSGTPWSPTRVGLTTSDRRRRNGPNSGTQGGPCRLFTKPCAKIMCLSSPLPLPPSFSTPPPPSALLCPSV
jgi:hypothetical protein